MSVFSLLEFARHVEIAARNAADATKIILESSAAALEEKTKSLFGNQQPGWPPLAPSTIDRKGADTPLLETGALRDSIGHTIEGDEAFVGTNDPKAKFHEFGTSHNPPRPFLGLAAAQGAQEIEAIAGTIMRDAINAGLSGHGLGALGEALHLAHDVIREGIATVHELHEEDEEGDDR